MFSFVLSKPYAVYVDYTSDMRPFYVGVGNLRRVNNPKRNDLHSRIVEKHGHVRRVEFESHDLSEVLSREEQLIELLKTYAHGGTGWWGSNLTRGGESSPMKDPIVAAKVSVSKQGHSTSFETRQKISESVRMVQARPEVRRKMSEASSKRKHSRETREKMSRSQKTRPKISEESRLKLREAAIRRESQKRVQASVPVAATGAEARSSTSEL